MSQHIPGKGHLKLLLFAYAVRPNTHRGFVLVFASSRLPLYPGQDVTHRGKAVSLETGIEQHLAAVAQVLHRVGLHISVLLLQTVKVSLLILTPLPFQNAFVLVGFTAVWAEQEEIGFSRTLGIRHNDFRRDRRLHKIPLRSSGFKHLKRRHDPGLCIVPSHHLHYQSLCRTGPIKYGVIEEPPMGLKNHSMLPAVFTSFI